MRKNQTVRLYDQLTAPGAMFIVADGNFDVGMEPVYPALPEVLRESIRVVADDVSLVYYNSPETVWDVRDGRLFNSLRLPFPSTWIEWVVPTRLNIGGKIEHRDREELAGCLLTSSSPRARHGVPSPWSADTVEVVKWTLIQGQAGMPPLYHLVGGAIGLDKDGRPTSEEIPTVPPHFTDEMNEFVASDIENIGRSQKVALLALSMMNYRNVDLDPQQPPSPPVSKKQRRPRQPGLSFHTIKLPSRAARSMKAIRDAALRGLPVHIVRAHHKTYSAVAPLLGKHIGTFFWGWHLRGDIENGISASDYEVGPPPD